MKLQLASYLNIHSSRGKSKQLFNLFVAQEDHG